jgi:hypothetical protein
MPYPLEVIIHGMMITFITIEASSTERLYRITNITNASLN